MKDINLKDLIDIINTETLTELEKAKEKGWSVETVRRYTKDKKLKVYRVKAKNLYNKER